eukprot:g8839.t1
MARMLEVDSGCGHKRLKYERRLIRILLAYEDRIIREAHPDVLFRFATLLNGRILRRWSSESDVAGGDDPVEKYSAALFPAARVEAGDMVRGGVGAGGGLGSGNLNENTLEQNYEAGMSDEHNRAARRRENEKNTSTRRGGAAGYGNAAPQLCAPGCLLGHGKTAGSSGGGVATSDPERSLLDRTCAARNGRKSLEALAAAGTGGLSSDLPNARIRRSQAERIFTSSGSLRDFRLVATRLAPHIQLEDGQMRTHSSQFVRLCDAVAFLNIGIKRNRNRKLCRMPGRGTLVVVLIPYFRPIMFKFMKLNEHHELHLGPGPLSTSISSFTTGGNRTQIPSATCGSGCGTDV